MPQSKSVLPVYDFSLSLNERYREKILPLFSKHRIAANPINYALLYDYVAEHNPELNKAIDALFAEQKTLQMEESHALYASFVCSASLESFETIHERIHRVLNRASDAVDRTFSEAEQAGDGFEQKTTLLENTSDIANHKAIILDIIRETRALAATTQAMQSELTRANAEMEELRGELISVRKVATTDGLTGLLNRHAFQDIMDDITGDGGRGTVSLAMLDIDFFKQVNDTWGHPMGDSVIKYVASLVKKHVADHHHVARYGGEELVIVMPDTDRKAAGVIAENIRCEMQTVRLKRKSDDQSLGEITLSIGLTEKLGDDTVDSFLNRADSALYKAKQLGRNRVVVG
ncbi:MAG: GGDEF domain-containing protein [Chromatocurvus sp.]